MEVTHVWYLHSFLVQQFYTAAFRVPCPFEGRALRKNMEEESAVAKLVSDRGRQKKKISCKKTCETHMESFYLKIEFLISG